MESKRTIVRGLKSAAVLGIVLCAGDAGAVTTAASAALACLDSGNGVGAPIAVGWGGLFNPSSSSYAYADCGGSTANWGSNSVSIISLYVQDFHSSHNLICNARIIRPDGLTTWSGAQQSTSGTPGVTAINWTSIPSGLSGIPLTSCRIPEEVAAGQSGVLALVTTQTE
jgi:hypothetical protein